jgi:Domain of unknown function (DUF4124)
MRRLIVLTAMAILAPTGSLGAATLNKCIDAQDKVTYSNLPCRNAKEVRKLEVDPAPPSEPAVITQPSRAQPMQAQPAPVPKAAGRVHETAATQPESPRAPKVNNAAKSAARASARECDTLSEQLGSVLDKMDKAHRKGYSQEQMDKWNQEVKNLESKKRQSGCF